MQNVKRNENCPGPKPAKGHPQGGLIVKVEIYDAMVRARMSRRRMLQGATALTALAALPMSMRPAMAQDDVRAAILKIPGVGMGSPTDADWQKVGEMCLAATKANVAEGEFAGVELTFLGLNNQNQHNFLFRGFLKPWEAYTGAKINWIDLAQADYNPRLQQSIATGTVDFDIIEMGAPFEGGTASKGLLDEMPDWVKTQIEADDLVAYLQPPVGTWDGKTYRINIDGDCHTFAYRKDYFGEGAIGGGTVPQYWEDVNAVSKALIGQTDPLSGQPAHGFVDPLKGWGGFGFYFLEDRASAYAKHPDDPAWLFDADTMKPRVNNPAWVQAI
jgi:multiple sugar transport system substrate-binding protein